MRPDHAEHPHTWYTTNLVDVPAQLLGSTAFNDHPTPLHIDSTRQAHAGLFALLATSGSPEEASEMFIHYLSRAFGLEPAKDPASPAGARRWLGRLERSTRMAITEQISALLAPALAA